MQKTSKIYVAGHLGLVGSAIVKKLREYGYRNLLLKTSSELNLMIQSDVNSFFLSEKPEFVFLAAAKVGGIKANDAFRAEFLYQNLIIEANVIHAAFLSGVKKLLFLGSSCVYPKMCPQPIKEEYLLTGPLENTNEPYAIAKIAGIKMCEAYSYQYGCDFFSVMPTNLYGPNDNYCSETSHVIPALIHRFHFGKITNQPVVSVWGSGEQYREFMYSEDLAEANIFIMNNLENSTIINVGTGTEITIKELATIISNMVGYKGEILFDISKPNGTFRKSLDNSKLRSLGFTSTTTLDQGLRKTYSSYLAQIN